MKTTDSQKDQSEGFFEKFQNLSVNAKIGIALAAILVVGGTGYALSRRKKPSENKEADSNLKASNNLAFTMAVVSIIANIIFYWYCFHHKETQDFTREHNTRTVLKTTLKSLELDKTIIDKKIEDQKNQIAQYEKDAKLKADLKSKKMEDLETAKTTQVEKLREEITKAENAGNEKDEAKKFAEDNNACKNKTDSEIEKCVADYIENYKKDRTKQIEAYDKYVEIRKTQAEDVENKNLTDKSVKLLTDNLKELEECLIANEQLKLAQKDQQKISKALEQKWTLIKEKKNISDDDKKETYTESAEYTELLKQNKDTDKAIKGLEAKVEKLKGLYDSKSTNPLYNKEIRPEVKESHVNFAISKIEETAAQLNISL